MKCCQQSATAEPLQTVMAVLGSVHTMGQGNTHQLWGRMDSQQMTLYADVYTLLLKLNHCKLGTSYTFEEL